MLTDHLPRVALAQLPTPLEEMPRLRQALGDAPRLLIKRDDQTGLATGGNKSRKLEFTLGHVLSQGADTVITAAGQQSNHCRQTAAAAARLGLRCVVVLGGYPPPRAGWNGNLLLMDLLGAEIRWGGDRGWNEALAQEADALRAEGARLYVVPVGASDTIGSAGYVAAVEELALQLKEQGQRVDRIVVTCGSGGTYAGLLVGLKALRLEAQLEGMNNQAIPGIRQKVEQLARETAAYLGLSLDFADEDFILIDACGTHRYGAITAAEREAIRLLARTEGIIVDPIYTGRALAAFVERLRHGLYRADETILFWHTGGSAGLFARAADMMV
ncbi:MAG: D-cysteine desulfhydrase family protein [Chloroflexota bacterium]